MENIEDIEDIEDMKMQIFNDEVEKELLKMNYKIVNRGNMRSEGIDVKGYEGCNWWRLKYKFLDISIYYDPIDALGAVGVPYYETYDGDQTERYIHGDPDGSGQFLTDMKFLRDKHKLEVEQFPELFL